MTRALSALTPCAVSSGLVRRGQRRLRWYCLGEGPVTVLLEPGAGIPATTWFPVLADIASRARVVLYDRAGFGCSDSVPQPALDAALGDLRAVVNVAARGPCVLTGHSWGGLLAQMFALAEPALVCGLVLVDPAHEQLWRDMPAHEREAQARSALEPDLSELRAERAGLREATARSTTSEPALRELLIRTDSQYADTEQLLRNSAAEVALIPANLGELASLRANGSPITVPAVVLTAMRGRPQQYCQPVLDIQEALVATMPRGRHEVVWDSGHYIHVDRPDRVTAAVQEVVSIVSNASGDHGAPVST